MNNLSDQAPTNITSSNNFAIYCMIFIFIVGITICLVCMFNNFSFNEVFNSSNTGINIAMISALTIFLSLSTSALYYMYSIIEYEVPSSLPNFNNNNVYRYFKR
jgi:predicted transporter